MRVTASATLLVALLVASAAAAAADAWQEVRSKEGGFVALFPAAPKLATEPADASGEVSHVFTARLGEAAYVVSYTDYRRGSFAGKSPQAILERARDRLVKGQAVEILIDRKLSLAGYQGREVAFADQDGYTQVYRLFVVLDRLYEVVSGGPLHHEKSLEAKRFFESFQFVGR